VVSPDESVVARANVNPVATVPSPVRYAIKKLPLKFVSLVRSMYSVPPRRRLCISVAESVPEL